jgi:hypothetical protein
MEALRHYQALRPNDPNALDSMGDVNLMLGQLHEAEQFYLDANKKSPAFLNGADTYKAAVARLMTGDVVGADTIYHSRYRDANPEWLWLTGQRKDAYGQLQQLAGLALSPEAASRACGELAIWSLLLDDRAAAAAWAQKAIDTPSTAGLNAFARFLVQPPASRAEWSARADRSFSNVPGKPERDLALGFALLLQKDFAAAADVLQQVYDHNPVPADGSTPIVLAWALIETGRFKDAAPLLRLNPVPGASGPGPFAGFYFPRLFELRARLLERGNPQEAEANRKVLAALSR